MKLTKGDKILIIVLLVFSLTLAAYVVYKPNQSGYEVCKHTK